ncbi:MAG: hypothetical protein Q7S22_03850 [Candidatus Micrarchaeota archaeon]|nr:hypothetical protein [Candidatus Micrarchaeota archaeon]
MPPVQKLKQVIKKKPLPAEEVPFFPPWKMLATDLFNAFKKRDQKTLRKLNDHILRETVTNFGKPLFDLAVVSYVLSKIVSKPRFLRPENEDRMLEIEFRLEKIVESLNGTFSEKEVAKRLEAVAEAIRQLERDDQRFLVDLMSKGKLKVAATMYAQGISLGVASEMTDTDKHEILDYAGKTMMFDRVKDEKSIHERLKIARQFITG